MGAVCADCSRDILALRAEMLRENHELSVQCAKLGAANVDLRKMLVYVQLLPLFPKFFSVLLRCCDVI
jgi:hypothetical protein